MADFKDLLASGQALQDDLALIGALGEVAETWRAKAATVRDLPSLEALLDLVVGDVGSDQAKAAFARIDAEPLRAKLSAALAKAVGADARIPDKYRPLLSRLSAFGADKPGLIPWTLIDKDRPLSLGDRIELALQAQASLAFEAAAASPFDDDTSRLLRLGAVGTLGATSDAAVPFQGGSLGARGSASAHAELHYYFAAPGALFAAAVAERLARLPDPFDFEAVWDAFAATDLAGLVYRFQGATAVEVEISLADTLAFDAGVVGALGAAVTIGVDLKGAYAPSFRAGSPATGGGRQILATLSRAATEHADAGLSVGLDLDISALADRLHAILQNAIGVWQGGLEKVQPFLSPGTWLRKAAPAAIDQAAAAIIGNQALRAAIVGDLRGAAGLDTTDTSAVAAWVAGELATAVETSGLLTSAEGQIGRVVDALAGRLLSFAQAEVRVALTPVVQGLAATVEAGLKAQVDALIGQDPARIQALGALLKATGEATDRTFTTADDALAGVRALIARYDALFRKVLAETRDAAHRKVSARIQFEEIRDREASYQVVGTLTGRNDGARAVFKALTTGDLKSQGALFSQAGAIGFDLDRERSAIRRFAKSQSKLGYEVILFGFGVTGAQLLSGESQRPGRRRGQYPGRHHGPTGHPLHRAARGPGNLLHRHLWRPVAQRPGERAAHRAPVPGGGGQRQPEGSVPDAWGGRGFHQEPGGRCPTAVRHDRAWRSAVRPLAGQWPGSADGRRHDRQAVADRPGAGDPAAPGRPAERAAHRGRQAHHRRHRDQRPGAGQGRRSQRAGGGGRVVNGYFEAKARDRTLPEVFLDYPEKWSKFEVIWQGAKAEKNQQLFTLFKAQHDRLDDLVQMIDLMGDVYEATPAKPGETSPQAWDEADYRDAQRRIAASSRNWLSLKQKFLFWAGEEVHPRTVALLCAIVELAGAGKQSPMTLTMTMTYHPTEGPPQTVALA